MEMWEKYKTKMETILENDELMNNDRGFVEKILKWVTENSHITPGQIAPINKIEHNLSDDADWKKYEKVCQEIIDHPECTTIGYDTATGINSYIQDTHFITKNQMTALDNVMSFLDSK